MATLLDGGAPNRDYHRSAMTPESEQSRWTRRTQLVVASGLIVVVVLGLSFYSRLEASYSQIEQIAYEPAAAAEAIEELSTDEAAAAAIDIEAIELAQLAAELAEADGALIDDITAALEAQAELAGIYSNEFAVSPALPDDMFRSYLLVGADESGFLADVIILFLQPSDGAAPIMVSLPRDLYVPNACSGNYTRINSNLGGCKGVANGPTLLSLTVRDFTGIDVDHFAVLDFSGFSEVVDAVGGVDLCFEHPTRDLKSHLDVGAGCVRADGDTTLAYVRSRRTEQFVDGAWVSTGASDFTRQRRQQDVLFLVAQRLGSFSSLASFESVAGSLANSVRLDSGLSFGAGLSLAWNYRGLTRNSVNRISIPIDNYRTSRGAQVLVPTRSFNDTLAGVYPAADR